MDNEKLIQEIIERAKSSEGEELANKAMERMKSLYANGTYVELKEQDIMKVAKSIVYRRTIFWQVSFVDYSQTQS